DVRPSGHVGGRLTMLHPEQAQKRLQELRDEKWTAARLKALAKMPKPLPVLGRLILAVGDDDSPANKWELRAKWEEEPFPVFDRMAAKERRRLFDALFPRFGGHVEAAWQLATRLPYQTEYARKSFRAPNDPARTLEARATWLYALAERVQGYDQDL